MVDISRHHVHWLRFTGVVRSAVFVTWHCLWEDTVDPITRVRWARKWEGRLVWINAGDGVYVVRFYGRDGSSIRPPVSTTASTSFAPTSVRTAVSSTVSVSSTAARTATHRRTASVTPVRQRSTTTVNTGAASTAFSSVSVSSSTASPGTSMSSSITSIHTASGSTARSSPPATTIVRTALSTVSSSSTPVTSAVRTSSAPQTSTPVTSVVASSTVRTSSVPQTSTLVTSVAASSTVHTSFAPQTSTPVTSVVASWTVRMSAPQPHSSSPLVAGLYFAGLVSGALICYGVCKFVQRRRRRRSVDMFYIAPETRVIDNNEQHLDIEDVAAVVF